MTRTTRLAAAAAVTLLGLSALTACGSSSDAASSSSSSHSAHPSKSSSMASMSMSPSSDGASTAVTLMIMDYKFSGARTVKPGAKITVVNHDSEAHTVTADHGGFDVKVAPGKSATLTAPSKPGSYAYHCTYHAEMHGTLTVG